MSTLGFGDITFSSDIGKLFSVVVLLSGIVFLLVMLPFTFIQFFYAPWLEEQNKARAPRAVAEYVRACDLYPFRRGGRQPDRKTGSIRHRYVIVTPSLQNALDLHDLGYKVVVGELDDPETYRRLRIDHAALVVVMNDDMLSTNIIFTIRETNAQVVTVTNADSGGFPGHSAIGGKHTCLPVHQNAGQGPVPPRAGNQHESQCDRRFDQLLIAEAPAMRTWLQGKTLAESRLREVTGVTVVGFGNRAVQIPNPQTRIGDPPFWCWPAPKRSWTASTGPSDAFRTGQTQRKGPVVVLGGGRVGQSVAAALTPRIDFRVVEKKAGIAAQDARYIQGSAGDLEVLVKAGIKETPSIIITTHDDNLNIYLTIYCRRLRPDAQIISRASLDRNINTLHRAGANLVMSFSSLVTTTIMNLLQPQQMLMLSEGLNVFRVALSPNWIETRPCADIQIREKHRLQRRWPSRRKGGIDRQPDPSHSLEAQGMNWS
jgi:Trk K+ transport system NAD-binding subunit